MNDLIDKYIKNNIQANANIFKDKKAEMIIDKYIKEKIQFDAYGFEKEKKNEQ